MNYSRFTRKELIKIIEKLSHDSAFGILTRTGLEIRMKGEYHCLFIDFDNIHSLNHTLGYDVVNQRIKTILSSLTIPGILVGRLFSGDEIVVLVKLPTYNIYSIEKMLKEISFKYNMTFKSKFYTIHSLEEVK